MLDEHLLFTSFALKLLGYSPTDFQGYVTKAAKFRSKNLDSSFDLKPLDVTSSSSEFERGLAKAQLDRIVRINTVVKDHSGS